ncbi:hypothetical protein GCM10009855_08320 [Gordonia cholesterolivorans]|uniref:Uncharacterized protein n=1 Tax=Gordonia cholesterolivorans TaxID=559625 RepID=A0ABN3H7C1_9ACTN
MGTEPAPAPAARRVTCIADSVGPYRLCTSVRRRSMTSSATDAGSTSPPENSSRNEVTARSAKVSTTSGSIDGTNCTTVTECSAANCAC